MTPKAKTAPVLADGGAAAPESLRGLDHITFEWLDKLAACPTCGRGQLSIDFLALTWFCNACKAGTPPTPTPDDFDPDERDHTAEDLAERYPSYETETLEDE